MPDWSATKYLQFGNERTQPSIDLANRIPGEPTRVLDIGCGPGNSTAVLGRRFPNAQIIGVDNSPNMIETAQKKHPEFSFLLCDVSNDLSELGKCDLVFSNACLQWVPNHRELLPKLFDLLNPAGFLAVQMPNQAKAPVHQIVSELVTKQPWNSRFGGNPRSFHMLSESDYYDLLTGLSSQVTMWETMYYHQMESHSSILEWYRGTGLRPYLNALSEEERPLFEQAVLEEIAKRYPVQKNGKILFRFHRLFFLAGK